MNHQYRVWQNNEDWRQVECEHKCDTKISNI